MRESKRRFHARLAGVLIVGAMAMTANAASTPSPDHPEWAAALQAEGSPITVFTAKKVYTMDPGRPEAEAIAVLDGRVLSTGTLESMKPWLSRYEYTVDDSLKDSQRAVARLESQRLPATPV